jgi:hypothetical protein
MAQGPAKANERRQPEFIMPSEAETLVRNADRLRDKCMLTFE